MPNPDHLAILKEGVTAWNAWRNEHLEIRANLREAELRGANPTRAILSGADLTRADLTQAVLTAADLQEADLRGANLYGANLYGAVLQQADPQGADLRGADLTWATLRGAKLYGAKLQRARLGKTVFADTGFFDAKGLDECRHAGPSTIDLRMLANYPNLPIGFLQGCGLSDVEIEFYKLYRKDLSQSQITDIGYKIIELRSDPAIQFHSCFISYSSKNDDFARKLHDSLQNKGVRCWFAPEDLKIGDKIRHAIDDAIRLHDKLLLILSQPAIESGWVEYEADRALSRELIDKRTILFPVRVDDSVFDVDEGWALHIKEDRHIGDFRAWKDHDAYQASFKRLLRDLKATG